MRIFVEDVKKISIAMLKQIEESGFNRVDFDLDYYWRIDLDDVHSEIEDRVLVGSLLDDLDCLKRIINKENILTTVDFDRIGSLFRAIGYIVCVEKKETINSDSLCIDINEVKYLCESILNKTKKAGLFNIDINTEGYLALSSVEVYNLLKSPNVLNRSLVDDWEKLNEVLINKRQVLGNDFDILAFVFELLGKEIDNSKDKVHWLMINE